MIYLVITTGNRNKQRKFRDYMGLLNQIYNLDVEPIFMPMDVREPVASPEEIILYKTSKALKIFLRDYQLVEGNHYYVMSEDTGLSIGSDTGIEIKFQLANVQRHIGDLALFRVMIGLADVQDESIKLIKYERSVRIIPRMVPEGQVPFGFDGDIAPIDSQLSYQVYKPMIINPRWHALNMVYEVLRKSEIPYLDVEKAPSSRVLGIHVNDDPNDMWHKPIEWDPDWKSQ